MELEDLKAHSYLLHVQQFYHAMQGTEDPVELANLAISLARKITDVEKFDPSVKTSVNDWASDDSGLKMS